MNTKIIQQLAKQIPTQRLLTDPAERYSYGFDNSKKHGLPDVVVLAECEADIQHTVKTCYQHGIPLTARGRGTGTTGACVPIKNGIVVSVERMNNIISIHPNDRYAIVEPGVLNQTLQDELAKIGCFWAPDPSSAMACTIGGNLALNASGPRGVKYGTPRENTLGLRAITGYGQKIITGTKTTKNVVGFDLTRLLIGSEGMLGIITEATLKLTPLSQQKITFRLFYKSIQQASQAISNIMAQPSIPCALEFIDHACLNVIKDSLDIPTDAKAMLIVEIDGNEHQLETAQQNIEQAAQNTDLITIDCAKTDVQAQSLWATRKALAPALRKIAKHRINEDIVVPVSQIPTVIEKIEQLSQQYQLPIINFGHAGNGNLHTNILLQDLDEKTLTRAHQCLKALFKTVLALDGALSGEHGVGLEKRDFVGWQIDANTLTLMRNIKQVFDPKNILNPDKVFPLMKSN